MTTNPSPLEESESRLEFTQSVMSVETMPLDEFIKRGEKALAGAYSGSHAPDLLALALSLQAELQTLQERVEALEKTEMKRRRP